MFFTHCLGRSSLTSPMASPDAVPALAVTLAWYASDALSLTSSVFSASSASPPGSEPIDPSASVSATFTSAWARSVASALGSDSSLTAALVSLLSATVPPPFDESPHAPRHEPTKRGTGDHIARVVDAEHQPTEHHRRHQHRGQLLAGQPAVEHGGRRRGRGVRRREAQLARSAYQHLDFRVAGALAPNDPLHRDRGGVRCRDAGRCGSPLTPAFAIGQRPDRSDGQPADGVLPEQRHRLGGLDHRRLGQRSLHLAQRNGFRGHRRLLLLRSCSDWFGGSRGVQLLSHIVSGGDSGVTSGRRPASRTPRWSARAVRNGTPPASGPTAAPAFCTW